MYSCLNVIALALISDWSRCSGQKSTKWTNPMWPTEPHITYIPPWTEYVTLQLWIHSNAVLICTMYNTIQLWCIQSDRHYIRRLRWPQLRSLARWCGPILWTLRQVWDMIRTVNQISGYCVNFIPQVWIPMSSNGILTFQPYNDIQECIRNLEMSFTKIDHVINIHLWYWQHTLMK